MKAATTTTRTEAPAPRFHFIGGKGGVGKTTCAAAFAVAAAASGQRVLVASTDPAPSLGDAFATPLGPVPRRIPFGRRHVSGVEIDAAKALRRWLKDRRPLLERIAVEGTWLDQDDVTRLLRLSLPGVDELAALLEIERLSTAQRYDLIVVDTAPTGHTLRMLAMPETLYGMAVVFDRMREKHRVMEEALRGAARPAAEDALVEELAATARGLSALVRDRARTRLSWVTLAEPMAVAETLDAIAALTTAGIGVDAVIANRLTPAPATPCGHCSARRALERRALQRLPPRTEVGGVGARDTEPRGVAALGRIGAELGAARLSRGRTARARAWKATIAGARQAPSDLLADGARLVLLGGKGGVGKTTCAAALALSAASRWPRRRVLLISSDPAHSLGDVFDAGVSDEAAAVRGGPGNLRVREIDPAAVFAGIRGRYADGIERAFDRIKGSGSFDAAHDRSVMRGLIDLAPPGLDELTAVLEITDAIGAEPPAWDLVVMDTAPTGHALRLLEMPALLQQWTRALMSILLKYQAVAGLGEFGEMLLNLSRGLGRLKALLADRDRTIFVAVTRPAALPRLETVRLVRRLTTLGIHVPAVVLNAVGRGTCRRCATMRTAERREIDALRKALAHRERQIVVAGAELPPPSGSRSLDRWGRTAWRRTPRYHQGS